MAEMQADEEVRLFLRVVNAGRKERYAKAAGLVRAVQYGSRASLSYPLACELIALRSSWRTLSKLNWGNTGL